MNEYQQKWLHELRSGGHTQGRFGLISDVSPEPGKAYCCLGVAACFVFGDDRVDENKAYLSTLSPEYLLALDLSRDEEYILGQVNDYWNFSFAQIADILELSFETGDSVLTSIEALHAGLFQR